jgi:hypothetical protein
VLVKHRDNFTFTSIYYSETHPSRIQWHHYSVHHHNLLSLRYERVSKSFRTELMITINTREEATQRVMAAKLTRMTHEIAIQLHLVAQNCTICSSRSRRLVRKLLDTPSYMLSFQLVSVSTFQAATLQRRRLPLPTLPVFTVINNHFC